jgi:hypothetical protein
MLAVSIPAAQTVATNASYVDLFVYYADMIQLGSVCG